MAQFENFRRMFSPGAVMQGIQRQNVSKFIQPGGMPGSPVGNAQARNSALAPAAGYSTSNPTGAQTAAPQSALAGVNMSPQFTGGNVRSPYPGFPDYGNQEIPYGARVNTVDTNLQGSALGVTTPASQAPSGVNPNSTLGKLQGINAGVAANNQDRAAQSALAMQEFGQKYRSDGYEGQQVNYSYPTATPDVTAADMQGYRNDAASADFSSGAGGAIGAGMANRFPAPSAVDPTKPVRAQSDAQTMDALTASGEAYTRPSSETGQRAYTSALNAAIDRGDATKANLLQADQDARFDRQAKIQQIRRESRGYRSEDEDRKIARMRSGVARGTIKKADLDNVIERTEKNSDMRRKIDEAGLRRDWQGARPKASALSGTMPTGAGAADFAASAARPQVREQATQKLTELTKPIETTPDGKPKPNTAPGAAFVQSMGWGPETKPEEIYGSLTSMPNDQIGQILADPAKLRDTFDGVREFYKSQKATNKDTGYQSENPVMDSLLSLNPNDVQGFIDWWHKIHAESQSPASSALGSISQGLH